MKKIFYLVFSMIFLIICVNIINAEEQQIMQQQQMVAAGGGMNNEQVNMNNEV